MTSSKREVMKIWAILLMVKDIFLGGGSLFSVICSFLPYFDMLTNKLLL